MGRRFGFSFSWRRATGLSAAKGKLSRAIGVPLTKGGRQRKAGSMLGGLLFLPFTILFGGRRSRAADTPGRASSCLGSAGGCVVTLVALFVIAFSIAVCMNPGGPSGNRGAAPAPAASAEPSGPSLLPEVRDWFAAHGDFGRPTRSEDIPDWARGKRQAVTNDAGQRLLIYIKDGEVETVYDTTPGHDRVILWGDYDRSTEPVPKYSGSRKSEESPKASRASRPFKTTGPDIKVGDAAESSPGESKEDASKRSAAKLLQAKALEARNPKGAIEYYRAIVTDFPDTPAAISAAERIEALGKK